MDTEDVDIEDVDIEDGVLILLSLERKSSVTVHSTLCTNFCRTIHRADSGVNEQGCIHFREYWVNVLVINDLPSI